MTQALCIFGEVLFDCFPDGSRVLGGAPFNVAWHLQAFGQAPVFISRVGSVIILGLRLGWTLDETLERAQAFASGLVKQRGATVADRNFYQPFLARWGISG